MSINSGNSDPETPNNNNNKISSIKDNSSKNLQGQTISQLRAKLYKLKQNEKDYDALNKHHKKLQEDFDNLNEAKLRIEYELKQRESEYNRHIKDLKGENEALQLVINDETVNSNSKKIFSDHDALEKKVGLKNAEIDDLNEKLSDVSNQYDLNQERKNEMTKLIYDLHETIRNQVEQIYKLKQDNTFLAQICQDNEKIIKSSKIGLHQISKLLDKDIHELKNLNQKIMHKSNNIDDLQHKLDKYNTMNLKCQNEIKRMDRELENLRNENDDLKNGIINERALRAEKEKQNDKLNNILMNKENQLNKICQENDKIQMMNSKIIEIKTIHDMENDKLKNQINILEQQNQGIINVIDYILEEDKNVKQVLKRKNRILSILHNNNDILEKSVNSLNSNINNPCNISFNDYNLDSEEQKVTYEFE